MSKIAVIYSSKYGSTKKYAEWIAQDLGADIFESKKFNPESFHKYSTIIYGGGIYAGAIKGFKLIIDNLGMIINNDSNKNLIVFSCGSSDSNDKSSMDTVTENFKKALPASVEDSKIKHFYLRGCLDYTKMNFMHKTMMKMMISMLKNKPDNEKTDADKAMINAYGGVLDFIDKSTIQPIIDYVKKL